MTRNHKTLATKPSSSTEPSCLILDTQANEDHGSDWLCSTGPTADYIRFRQSRLWGNIRAGRIPPVLTHIAIRWPGLRGKRLAAGPNAHVNKAYDRYADIRCWEVTSRTPEALEHLLASIDKLIRDLNRASLIDPVRHVPEVLDHHCV